MRNLCKPEWGQKKKANVIFPESLISYDIIPYTSYHTSEIPFVFNNIDKADTTIGGGEEAQLLSDRMSQAWINFARTGNPSVDLHALEIHQSRDFQNGKHILLKVELL